MPKIVVALFSQINTSTFPKRCNVQNYIFEFPLLISPIRRRNLIWLFLGGFVLLWGLQYCCILQHLTDVYVHNLNYIKTCREHNFECLIISHRWVTRNYPETQRNPEVQNPLKLRRIESARSLMWKRLFC